MKILFDPTLYEVNESDAVFANDYLKYLLNYLDDYVGDSIIKMTSSLVSAFYIYICSISKSASTTQQAYKKFLLTEMVKRISTSDCIEDESEDGASFRSINHDSVSPDTFEHFTNMIGGISANIEDYLLFLGKTNYTHDSSISFRFREKTYELSTVGNIKDLEVRLFSDSLRKLLLENAVGPSLKAPLPNAKLCKDILEYQIKEIISADEKLKIATIIRCASEVAQRNFYKYSQKVTSLNKSDGKLRRIFVDVKSEKDIYISIDIRHGNFEVYNNCGKHQDEYDYCGNPQGKTDDKSAHDIKVP